MPSESGVHTNRDNALITRLCSFSITVFSWQHSIRQKDAPIQWRASIVLWYWLGTGVDISAAIAGGWNRRVSNPQAARNRK